MVEVKGLIKEKKKWIKKRTVFCAFKRIVIFTNEDTKVCNF